MYYVNDNGIYKRIDGAAHKCIMTKEIFVEAYEKWIKNGAVIEDARLEKEKVVVVEYLRGATFYCPKCHKYLGSIHNELRDVEFCYKCGQALDFGEYKEQFRM